MIGWMDIYRLRWRAAAALQGSQWGAACFASVARTRFDVSQMCRPVRLACRYATLHCELPAMPSKKSARKQSEKKDDEVDWRSFIGALDQFKKDGTGSPDEEANEDWLYLRVAQAIVRALMRRAYGLPPHAKWSEG